MTIEFLGVGEAFDAQLGNSSFLIRNETSLLIDCGYAIPERFFQLAHSANFLDAVYLTHFHADHSFGLPPLLVRLREDGRTAPLTIISQPGVSQFVEKLVELAYPGNYSRLGFALEFIETLEPCRFNEFSLFFAPTRHSVRNLALRIEFADERIAFSGDGELTPESRALFSGCSVLVHEAYTLDRQVSGHTSALELLEVCDSFPALESLLLVHISREERRLKANCFQELGTNRPYSVLIPDPGFVYSLL